MPQKRERRKAKRPKPAKNVIGPQVRRLRYERGWTQAILTARCARLGWDLHYHTIAKIEAGLRCVSDRELILLAKALRKSILDLVPDR
jgi:hypothetical protein